MGRLLGDLRDHLEPGRPGAHDGHPLAGEVDGTVGPSAGVEDVALERLDSRDLGILRNGQAAHGRDKESTADLAAPVGGDLPSRRRLVEDRSGDHGVELDVAPQVEAVGDVVGVPQHLGLGGEALRPVPLLFKLVAEPVGVVDALDVTAGAGVAVPVPRAADTGSGFEHPHGEAGLAETVEHVHAGEAGADHDCVPHVGAFRPSRRRRTVLCHVSVLSPTARTVVCFTITYRIPRYPAANQAAGPSR